MTQQLFKATWHLTIRDISCLIIRATEWLQDNDGAKYFVNHYVNDSNITGRSEYVVVLPDRNTALMLKLAIS